MYIHCSIVLVLSVSLSDSLTWYNRCYSIQNKRMLRDLSHAMKVWEHWKAFCRQKDSSKLDYQYFLSPSQILLINVTEDRRGKDAVDHRLGIRTRIRMWLSSSALNLGLTMQILVKMKRIIILNSNVLVNFVFPCVFFWVPVNHWWYQKIKPNL